jgi:hypothetical protein
MMNGAMDIDVTAANLVPVEINLKKKSRKTARGAT